MPRLASPRVRALFIRIVALAALAVLTSNCLNHPRNNQVQPSKGATIAFDGFYLSPSQQIRLYVQNNATHGFDPIAHAPIYTDSSPVQDKAGGNWYSFGANDVVLPGGPQYWSAGASGFNVAHVKAIGDNPPNSPMQLTTFDVDADSCINTYLGSGGISVISNCRSAASPVVAINATCGGAGGDCCLGQPACNFGDNCSGSTCSTPCGATGGACCRAAPFCSAASTACVGQTPSTPGVCTHCGATGEPCCAGVCSTGNTCGGSGLCECGKANQPCCNVVGCTQPGTVCAPSKTCVTCGTLGHECCANNTCSQGTCVGTSPPLCACGQLDEACCPGNSCSGGNTCNAQGICAAPGKPAQCQTVGQTCGTSTGPFCCANSNLLCNGGRCTTCIPHDSSCKTTDVCCTAGETCILGGDVLNPKPFVCGVQDGPPN